MTPILLAKLLKMLHFCLSSLYGMSEKKVVYYRFNLVWRMIFLTGKTITTCYFDYGGKGREGFTVAAAGNNTFCEV